LKLIRETQIFKKKPAFAWFLLNVCVEDLDWTFFVLVCTTEISVWSFSYQSVNRLHYCVSILCLKLRFIDWPVLYEIWIRLSWHCKRAYAQCSRVVNYCLAPVPSSVTFESGLHHDGESDSNELHVFVKVRIRTKSHDIFDKI
jgi:hypothetical protein